MAEPTVTTQKARADRAWSQNAVWDQLYADAYDFALPNRRPGGNSKGKATGDRLFDMTAPTSAMHLAGTLQRLLFSTPPALTPGALVRQMLGMEGPQGAQKLAQLERELERTGEFIYPFMEAGDLDTSTNEMCIDLGFGTGVLIPMRGTADQPVVFFAPPADECAFACDAYGRITMMSWKRMAERGAVRDAFPDGQFSSDFLEAARSSPNTEVTLYQDFYKRDDGKTWQFCAYLDTMCTQWIAAEVTRTKPFVSPRYYRVAGETRGRGPILLALPTIKVVNMAQQLALKAASIQMLGIWGYRANSGFNPDTASQSPGSFWAMQSTGGIMGPDVQRLDPASGRLDVASMVIDGAQQQIRDVLLDTRLAPDTGTPKSASEIAARLRQNSQVHLGAYMRMHREVHPEIVPRVAEILNSFGYLRGLMDFNQLIVSVGVRSPMAAALSAEQVSNLAHYAELMTALSGGPQNLPEHLLLDDAADAMADGLMIPKRMVPDAAARQAIRDEKAKQQQQFSAMALAQKAAPQVATGVMQMIQGGKQAA